MKKDIVYLKQDKYGDCAMAIDLQELKSVEVYKNEQCTIEKYDDQEDLEEHIERFIKKNDWKIASRNDFNTLFVEYSKRLNEITKDL